VPAWQAVAVTHHDLVIVGSGSGNSIADEAFASSSVAIVDGGTFGGTCLNVGCIPTKMFVYPADVTSLVRDEASSLGLRGHQPRADWPAIRDRIFTRVDSISAAGKEWRRAGAANTTLYDQQATLVSPRTLRLADGTEITADTLVLAGGSRPVLPEVAGLNEADVLDPMIPVHTSDTIMRLDRLPERLVVVGSGYVASEFAHIFSAYGVEVTQIARSGLLLRHFDHDIATGFTKRARAFWRLLTHTHTTTVRASCSGVEVGVRDRHGVLSTLAADALLVATGRRPNSDTLGLARVGYDLEPDGRLSVDTYQRALSGGRPVSGVFGLGDLSSPFQLKHVANHEAKVVRHNLLHPSQLWESDHRFVPAVVFSHPQVASVGLTEAEARQTGRPVVIAIHPYAAVAFGWAMAQDERTGGFAKVLADSETGDLLGAHILGAQASLLLQPLVTAMSFGIPARTLARGQYWPHPALSEVVENALLSLKLSAGAR
jgi:mycothione reductase